VVARLSLSVCVLRFVLLLCAVLVLCLMGLAACNKFFVRSFVRLGHPKSNRDDSSYLFQNYARMRLDINFIRGFYQITILKINRPYQPIPVRNWKMRRASVQSNKMRHSRRTEEVEQILERGPRACRVQLRSRRYDHRSTSVIIQSD